MEQKNVLKISETCRVIGLSRYYVDRLIKDGKLEVVYVGTARFVTVTSVKKLMAELERSDRYA